MAAGTGAAIYSGNDSGHGTGVGGSHHPGLGGGTLSPCPHPPLLPAIKPKTVTLMNSVLIWPPTPQLPLNPLTGIRTVFINNLFPIVDQDMLTPHPTPTQLTTTSIGYQCATTVNTPGWWCTKGIAGGREAPTGPQRKLFATSKSVWINGRRAGRFGDPLGDLSIAFPCTSVVTGCSPNVFIGI